MGKKKSPAELKEEGKALGDMITLARKRDLNFAMLVGKEGLALEADPKKSADIMRRQAKANGGGSKGVQGILRVNGKVVEFHCVEEDPPRVMLQLAKQHFRDRGQKVKIAILTPSGGAMDDSEDDADEDVFEADEASLVEDGEAAEAAGDDVPDEVTGDPEEALRKRLAAEYETLKPLLAAAAESPSKRLARRSSGLAEKFEETLADKPDRAGKVLNLLRDTLAEAGLEPSAAAPATGPDAAGPVEDAPPPGGGVPPADDGPVDAGVPPVAGIADAEPLSTQPPEPGAPLSTEPDAPATDEDTDMMMSEEFGAFWEQVCEPSEEDSARHLESSAIALKRAEISALFAGGLPTPEKILKIAEVYASLAQMVETARQIAALEEKNPEAATEARQAMAAFDGELGEGTKVTPELLAKLETDRQAAQARMDAAEKAMEAAQALPPGKPRDEAIKKAQAELDLAGPELEAAQSKQRAAKGKKQLTEAITVGPLSPIAPRPFSDESAAKFVEAFTRQPDLATYAVETASTLPDPEAVAGGMAMLCDNLENGFSVTGPDGSVQSPPEGFDGNAYARNLIRGAGTEGGAYMEDAQSYLEGGGHLVSEPITTIPRRPKPPSTASKEEKEAWKAEDIGLRQRERTHFIADSLLGPDGTTIDPFSDEAQQALGHLRFSPDVIDEPAPEVTGRVKDMHKLMRDPTNRGRAETILSETDAPQTEGAAALVGRSAALNQSVVKPDAMDARQAVMMSLLTPVHQGKVGSCFASAGVRRMSELDPLEAMNRYAEIAETGEFKPRNGMDAIPAVQSFPDYEDPLIRTFEYSAATVMAAMPDNERNEHVQKAIGTSIENLIGPVGDSSKLVSGMGFDNWEIDKKVIEATLKRAFAVEYDSTTDNGEVSADGRSKKGGYFLLQLQGKGTPPPRPINTEALFVEVLTERVITCLALDPKGDKGKAIAAEIASKDYLAALKDGDMAPWKLGVGGYPNEADEVIFGTKQETDVIISWEGWFGNAVNTQGDRTEDILEGLLEQFDGADSDMISLTTSGIHVFNGLPNHPSLAPLQEGGDFDDNIEEHLLKPGREIASTPLPDHHGQEVLDEVVDRLKKWEGNAARDAMIDTAKSGIDPKGKTPGQLSDAILAALSAYLDAEALVWANNWRQNRINGGTPTTEADRDKEKDRRVDAVRNMVDAWIFGKLAKVAPGPQFTIADSNWGDAEGRTEFVIAPDPRTGEPRLWSKSIPSGHMMLTGEKWEDTTWYETLPDK